MTRRITVVVPLSSNDDELRDLVASLDAQTLRFAEFEVLFVVGDAHDDVVARVTTLCRHRPNMRLVRALDPAETLATVLADTESELVTLISPADALLPQALASLHAAASDTRADVVVGRRTRTPGRRVASGHVRLQAGDVHPDHCVALRREYALELGLDGPLDRLETDWAVHLRRAAENAAVIAGVPGGACLRGRLGNDHTLRLGPTVAEWHGGSLHVTVEVHEAADGLPVGEALARVVLRGRRTEVEQPVETAVAFDGLSLELRATIDLSTAVSGAALVDDVRLVDAELIWDDDYASGALRRCELQPALLNGRLVTRTETPRLALEVGRMSRGVVDPAPHEVSISEAANGTLLTIDLPELRVHGDAHAVGRIFLGRLALPAELVADDGRASIRAFVSGLAGTYPIAIQFGTRHPVPLDLELCVSGVGEMSVTRRIGAERTPSDARADVPPTRPLSSTQSFARVVRGHAPRQLVDAIARVPGAKSLYRRLSGR